MTGTSSQSRSITKRLRRTSELLSIPEDTIIVIGNGPNMESDLARLEKPFDVMSINRSMLQYDGKCKYWATWHDSDDEEWRMTMLVNASKGRGLPEEGFSHMGGKFATYLPMNCYGGGSTLYGVLVCLNHLKYKRVIVANSPLSEHYVEFLEGWKSAMGEIKDRVRALSGEPMKLLGEPTQEWLGT